jgi:hypothetical protein
MPGDRMMECTFDSYNRRLENHVEDWRQAVVAQAVVEELRSDLCSGCGGIACPLQRAQAASAKEAERCSRDRAQDTHNLFTEIGVRPILNAQGTFTIISGSRSLPEVKQAMYEASFYFVHLDEMMDGIGQELGQTHRERSGVSPRPAVRPRLRWRRLRASPARISSNARRLPYIEKKKEVIIPHHSRNPYDFGIRMTGAELGEVASEEELRSKISERTAMIYILSSPAAEKGPLRHSEYLRHRKREGNSCLRGCSGGRAARSPNIHIQHGASLVGYSGGKCMRGPQSSGMLIGQKDLCRAAYYQAAPHHNYGRAFQVQQGRGDGTAGRCAPVVQARS